MRLLLSISLLLLLADLGLPEDHELPPALVSLAAAERAFARTSVEKGFRESFLTRSWSAVIMFVFGGEIQTAAGNSYLTRSA